MQVSSLSAVFLAAVLFTVAGVHAAETASVGAAGQSTVIANADAAGDRMVCEYEKPVGSHMKKRVCKTVAQRNKEREESRSAMDSRSVCGNCKSD